MREEELKDISVHTFDPTLSNLQKARYHFLRGRLLNIFESFNQSAEDNLIRSVKLAPRSEQTWIELGECYWKKGDLEAAENCFNCILEMGKNKNAFTLLAMLQRRKQKGLNRK